MQRFCIGVLAGCVLSLFLPMLSVFFIIIFLLALPTLWWCRQFFLLGVCTFLACWLWHLQGYWQAIEHITTQPYPYYEVSVARITDNGVGDLSVQVHLEHPEFKGYKLQLRWRNAPDIYVGQRWRLVLALKPVRTTANPARRATNLTALSQHVIAEGYVVPEQPTMLLYANKPIRQSIITRVATWSRDTTTQPALTALTVGERHFNEALWQGILHSGLGHILTISGLHIGLVYGWAFWLSGAVLKCLSIHRKLEWQLLIALLPALCYAWLAGFAVPTLRAAAALLVVIAARLLGCPLAAGKAWCLLTAMLLLIQPFWLLSYSFWLSVLAVGIIILLAWRLPMTTAGFKAKLWYFCCFHICLSVLMSLIGLAFFNGVTALAILSNMLFVPWCSLVAIPVLLCTLCWSVLQLPYAEQLWQLSDWLFMPLWWWVHFSASLPVWWSVPHITVAIALLITAALIMLFLLGLKHKATVLFVLSLLLVLGIPQLLLPATKQQVVLLDSGQRTVLLALQPPLTWLYLDAPPEQMEALIRHSVLPQLRYQRVTQLGPIIIPALQQDMLPAITLLLRYYPKAQIFSADADFPGSFLCSALETEYPQGSFSHWSLPDNDPCVISADFADWTLLLPGEITVKQEHALLQRYPTLTADLYLLADYGRPTANSLHWLQHLSPQWLLLSANQYGAYRYPLNTVQQRLNLLDLKVAHSGEQGAVTITFSAESMLIHTEKQRNLPRWVEKPAAIAETW